MKKFWWKVTAAALCLALMLAGCKGAQPALPDSTPAQSEVPPGMAVAYGVVLDYTDGTLIFRTNSGLEYVLKLSQSTILPEEGIAAGARVEVVYDGSLDGKGENRPDIYRVSAAQAQAIAPVYTGSTIDGVVTQAALNDTAIRTAQGKEYTFTTADNVQALRDGAQKGMWIRIVFDGALEGFDTSGVIVRSVLECAAQPDTVQTPGTVRSYDEAGHTMTVQASDGTRYSFDTEFVELDTPNGLRTGSQVVVYSRGQLAADGEKAQQALVYRVSDVRLSPVRQLEGVVERAEEDGGLVLHLCDGRVITVYGKQSGTQEELDAGDVVRVSYTGELMGTDTRQMKVQKIELRAAALDAETSVLGTVSQVSGSAITLEACDGRTLHFSQLAPGGEISSELKKGDTVRVYYTGWLGIPQDTADTSGAKVVRAVFAYN